MDFNNAANWNKTFNGQQLNLKTPLSCCKEISGEFPDIKYPDNTDCATNPQDSDSYYMKVREREEERERELVYCLFHVSFTRKRETDSLTDRQIDKQRDVSVCFMFPSLTALLFVSGMLLRD